MAKGKMNPPVEGPGPQLNPETIESQVSVENKYPGVSTRAYRTSPIELPVVETPVEETPVEDAQESVAE